MTITIRLKTDNAAFEDKDQEVTRILHRWIERAAMGWLDSGTVTKLMDYNGNAVGTITVRGK